MAITFDPITPVQAPTMPNRVTYNPPSYDPIRAGYYQHMQDNERPNVNPFGLLSMNGVNNSGSMSSLFSLIPAVGSILANLYNINQQKQMIKQQQEWQKEFYDYTFDKQREEYWKQQEYNNPANQMLRLEAAGLNPNLMYGSGSAVNAGNAQALNPAGESGKFQPTTPYFDADSVITSLMTPLQAFSQMHLNQAKSVEALEAAGLSKSNAVKIGLLTPLEQQRMTSEIYNLAEQHSLYRAQILKTAGDAKSVAIYNSIAQKMYDYQLREIKARIGNLRTSSALNSATEEKIYNEIYRIMPALANSYNADASVKWKNAEQISKLLPSLEKQAKFNAGIAEKDFNNYFWTRFLPAYLSPALSAGAKIGSAAMLAP